MRTAWLNFVAETLDKKPVFKVEKHGIIFKKKRENKVWGATTVVMKKDADGIAPITQTNNFLGPRRFTVQDQGGSFKDGFDIFDTQTRQRHKIDFAFAGTDNNNATTWDFAPLGEMQEVDGRGFNNFRTRLHQDDRFVAQQVMMNRREDIFHQAGKKKGVTSSGLHMFGGQFRDPQTDSNFFMTSDVRYGRETPPFLVRLEYHVAPIFKPLVNKIYHTKLKINTYLKLNRSPDQILKEYAEMKSDKLLKSWLSEKEYDSLMNLGEMEIYNDDEIFIIKKNPNETVRVKKNNGRGDCQVKQEYCIIPDKYGYATGDVLLSKIMMIKTDPEKFKQVAILRR